jgi:hypothetical protein
MPISRTIILVGIVCLAAAGPARGAANTGDVYRVAVHATSPLAVAAGKAAGDSVYLIGGPGQLSGKFEDDLGQPDSQGWVGVDWTEPPGAHWHVDTFQAANLDPGEPTNHAWWCGEMLTSCGGADPAGGYGNDWRDWLEWYGTVADTNLGVDVRVTAVLNHDTEPGYDILTLEYETAAGLQVLASFDGQGLGVALDDTCTLAPGDYVGPGRDQVHLRFRFVSDASNSDTDCGYPTSGAAQMDRIEVFFDQGTGFSQVGATETCETGPPLQWTVGSPPGVGNFAQVWPLLDDADPLAQNDTPQFAFVDDGIVVPGTGGYLGQTWTYGPGGYIVNPEGGLAGPSFHLHDEIWSPPVPWPGVGYDGARLAFDIYRHLPEDAGSPGIFYIWHLRSTNDPAGLVDWTPWRDRGEVYAGDAVYYRHVELVRDLLLSDRTYVQVALGAYEYGWTMGLTGTDGTPAPYFDNVALLAYDFTGYVIRDDGSGDFRTIQAALDAPDVADGDTLWLADGTYRGDGNRDLDFHGKQVVLISQSGDPTSCIIDCEGSSSDPHRGLRFLAGEGTGMVVEGVTIRNGYAASEGGAVHFAASVSVFDVVFMNCRFENNSAVRGGAAWYFDQVTLSFTGCVFAGNEASEAGGAVYSELENTTTYTACEFLDNTAPQGGALFYYSAYGKKRMPASPAAYDVISGCRFSGNMAQNGGAVYCQSGASPNFLDCVFQNNFATEGGAFYAREDAAPHLENCLIWENTATRGGALSVSTYTSPFSDIYPTLVGCTLLANGASEGGAIDAKDLPFFPILERCLIAFAPAGAAVAESSCGVPAFSCCDIYGNQGGDWIGPLADLEGSDGNFSANPLLCVPADSLLTLASNSPCLPGLHPDGAPCGQIGAQAAGCGNLTFAPDRVALRAQVTPHVHPSDSIAVVLTILDAGGSRVPDEGTRPSLASPAKGLGSVSFLALQPDTAWVAFYRAGPDTGREMLTGLDPEAATAPQVDLEVQITETAIIVGVQDIPNDQGRQVRVTWQHDLRDALGASPAITEYVVWRRVDDPLLARERPVLTPESLGEIGQVLQQPAEERPLLEVTDVLWEPVGPSVPTLLWPEYSVVAPTLADSTEASIHWSVFFVSAHTSQPHVFFISPIDSGYSVDNLSPYVPEGLIVAYGGAGNQLSWQEHNDEDFQYFRVYRGIAPDFIPDAFHLVHATTDNSWFDSGNGDPWNWHYKITAVDFSGRESDPASPISMTGVSEHELPLLSGLHPNVPNPFNPQTTIAYDVGLRAGSVSLCVYDMQGRLVRTLVDAHQPVGRHEAVWNGRNERGVRVPSGIYFCRLLTPGTVATIKMTLVQ